MFWFSPSLREETKQAILSHRDDAVIQPFEMIWARTDNSGICPDPQRYGRRTYDTAMLITFGDRLIVTPKSLSICAPWGEKIHRSQKPLPVVQHFMSMFVDKHSTVLDPTCGSGTALVAARELEAKSILGLEADPETHKRAVRFYKEQL
jgi:DNA modification methylase